MNLTSQTLVTLNNQLSSTTTSQTLSNMMAEAVQKAALAVQEMRQTNEDNKNDSSKNSEDSE
jgi:hypothetical protein